MEYRALIHDDNTVSLIADMPGMKLWLDPGGAQVVKKVNITADEYDDLRTKEQENIITYEDDKFKFTSRI